MGKWGHFSWVQRYVDEIFKRYDREHDGQLTFEEFQQAVEDHPFMQAFTERMVREGSEMISDMGGFFSRPYGPWKDTAYRRAGGTLIMQRKLKEIFDPNAILNPGKLCF